MSGIRCENLGCRGNAPCPACLAGLSAVVIGAFSETVSCDNPLVNSLLVKNFIGTVKRNLDAYWARSVAGTTKEKTETDTACDKPKKKKRGK